MARLRWAPVVAGLALLVGCAAPADEPPTESAAETTAETAADAPSTDAASGAADQPTDGDGATSGFTEAEIGTGTVQVAGVDYDGISGTCDAMRNFGADPLLALGEDGVTLQLAVDNVSSGTSTADEQITLVVTSLERFTLGGAVAGEGTIDLAVIVEPRTELESVDLAEVGITGLTDDGRTLVASIVCVLAKPGA